MYEKSKLLSGNLSHCTTIKWVNNIARNIVDSDTFIKRISFEQQIAVLELSQNEFAKSNMGIRDLNMINKIKSSVSFASFDTYETSTCAFIHPRTILDMAVIKQKKIDLRKEATLQQDDDDCQAGKLKCQFKSKLIHITPSIGTIKSFQWIVCISNTFY